MFISSRALSGRRQLGGQAPYRVLSGGGADGLLGCLVGIAKRESRGSHGLGQSHVGSLVVERAASIRQELRCQRGAAGVDRPTVAQAEREREQVIDTRVDPTATDQQVTHRRRLARLAQDTLDGAGQPEALGVGTELFGAQRELGARCRIGSIRELLVEVIASPPRSQPQPNAGTGRP
jgi:hypothetical protein